MPGQILGPATAPNRLHPRSSTGRLRFAPGGVLLSGPGRLRIAVARDAITLNKARLWRRMAGEGRVCAEHRIATRSTDRTSI
ncbi:hypothetical protein [Actinoplanes sp. HUAS TT8]|uniref:hypothetical protein n=1 Tax=Actinoplanes sp. HUAS TT8 TaxID=3447453 RepID=UPI003F521390